MQWLRKVSKGHILCALAVAVGLSAYGWEGVINFTYALRHSSDEIGKTVSPGQMVSLSIGAFVMTGIAGWLWREGGIGNRLVGGLLFVLALIPLGYSFTNSVAWNFEQTVGRARLTEALNKQARDLAAEQVRARAEERKAQLEWVQRTYERMAKSRNKDDRQEARTLLSEQSKELLSASTPLAVPAIKDLMPDGKAEVIGRWLGLSGEDARLGDSIVLSAILKLFEWLFPMLGFSYWPRGARAEGATVAQLIIQPTQPTTPILPQPVRTTDSEERQASELQLVSEWLSIGCVHVPGDEHRRVLAAEAYDAFRQWCQKAKHAGRVLTVTSFGNRLKELGIEKSKGKVVYYLGLSLRSGSPKLTVVSHHAAPNAA